MYFLSLQLIDNQALKFKLNPKAFLFLILWQDC